MTISITESDGTKRTLSGAIQSICIDIEERTLSIKVLGMTTNQGFTVKGVVEISEENIFPI